MKKYEDAGITLIALIVTIIVLLILVGVSLSLVTGSDGILGRAEKSVEVTNDAVIKEETEMAITEYIVEYYSGEDVEAIGKTFQEYVSNKLNGYETPSGGLIISDEDENLTYTDKNGNTVILSMDSSGIVKITGKITVGGNVVDTAAPRVKINLATTNSITFTITDGIGVVAYAITETNSQPSDWVSIETSQKYTTTVSGKIANQTYYVWAKDNAGNVSNAATAATGEVAEASSSNVSYTTTWSGTNAIVTFETTSGFTVQTSTDGSTWNDTNPITVATGTQIYVRLSDGANVGVSYAAVMPVKQGTVTYNANGGTGSVPATQTQYHKDSVEVSFDTLPIKEDYIVIGWSRTSTDTEAEFTESNNNFEMGTEDVILYAIWEPDWHTWLENAGLDYSKYTSLNDFITNGTSTEKTTLAGNANARSYLLSKTVLIDALKSTTDYGSGMVSYLLSTDSTKNKENYNVGLPAYICNGNTLYLGGSWFHGVGGYGTYSLSNSSYVYVYMPVVNGGDSWGHALRSSSTINFSKFTVMKAKGYISSTKGGTTVKIGSVSDTDLNAWKQIDLSSSLVESKVDLGTNTNSFYFGLFNFTYGATSAGWLYYAYIY